MEDKNGVVLIISLRPGQANAGKTTILKQVGHYTLIKAKLIGLPTCPILTRR